MTVLRSYSCAPLHGIPSCPIPLSSLHGFSAYHCTEYCAFHISMIIIHIYVRFTYHGYTCLYGFFILVVWKFPILDMRAVDMRYVDFDPVILFPLYCSRFPLYCSMLSTELRSCYHVTRIMYCICSCYIGYLTYQIIMITGVWGRLDG